jgi:hypothetical protein
MKTAFVFFYLLFSFTVIIAQNPIADSTAFFDHKIRGSQFQNFLYFFFIECS